MRTLRCLVLASLLVLFLCPISSHAQTDEESMLARARQHFSKGNYYLATTWLERIIKKYPATPRREEVLLMASKAYDLTGQDEKAAQTLRTLLKDYPEAAKSLDPRLLKLAGYGPPESASPDPAAQPAPAAPTVNTAAPPPTVEPAASAAAVPSEQVPKPAEPSPAPSPQAVAVSPPATAEPAEKTTAPTVAEPAAPRPATATVPQILLSRMSAIAMTIRKNIDLRIEALNSSMAEADAARNWGIYNPVFNASATAGVSATTGDAFFRTRSANASLGLTQNLPTGGSITATSQAGYTTAEFLGNLSPTTNWQSSAGLSISQPLLKNAGKETMELNITLAANGLQDSLERFRSTTTDTVNTVITSYNHLYALRQVLESRVSVLNSAQKLLDEIKKKEKQGPLQAMEVANAEFAIIQRRKDLVDAERSVRDQEASLRYLIGMESRLQIIPIDPPAKDEPEETEEQAVRAALAIRSDLKQLYSSLKTSQLQERVARHQTWPDLSINAGGGFTGLGNHSGDSFRQLVERPGTYWSAGMQFSVPLGNTAARNDYLRSKIRTEQVQNQIKALEWRVRNDIEADLRALISARLQRQTAERSQQIAEQRLEEYRKNNQLGTATVQDVINAENDLTYARNSHMDAMETFANAVTRLWRDTGELLDREGVYINAVNPANPTAVQEDAAPAP